MFSLCKHAFSNIMVHTVSILTVLSLFYYENYCVCVFFLRISQHIHPVPLGCVISCQFDRYKCDSQNHNLCVIAVESYLFQHGEQGAHVTVGLHYPGLGGVLGPPARNQG